VLARADVWVPGLVFGAVLAFVIRPVFVGLCLIPARLRANERSFVLFAGLKGAVPILLGGYLLTARIADATRLYGIVVIVVVFSVVVQGSLVGAVARRLRLPVQTIDPEPWALGVRLRDEPEGVQRLTVAAGSPADGASIAALAGLPAGAWVTLLVRDGQLVAMRGNTRLRAGDAVTVLCAPEDRAQLRATFEQPRAG
jgi:cell volume regulation protein A